MKWTTIPDLVERRKVFLKGGFAYVPAREQASIIYAAFEERLDAALLVSQSGSTFDHIPHISIGHVESYTLSG